MTQRDPRPAPTPETGSRKRLGALRFRTKLFLLPGIACLAFGAILVATPFFAGQNRAHLERIEDAYLPTLELSRDLEDILDELQEGLQNAAAAENASALEEADAQRTAFSSKLQALGTAGLRSREEVREQRALFDEYFWHARQTTARVISQGFAEDVLDDLETMRDRYNHIRSTLEERTETERVEMAEAFDAAIDANEQAFTANVLITALSLLILVLLSMFIGRAAMHQLKQVSDGFARMGAGDFSQPVPVTVRDELGELGEQVNETSKYLGDLVDNLRQTAAGLNTAAAELSAAAHQHQSGAAEQSSAVEETQRTMSSILTSTDQINKSVDLVLRNAEQTQAKNQLIGESILSLSGHTDRIAEVLGTIKEIANKAELLALNAALEGTKAGEVGRGFSIVATQMQRLAENVSEAVGNIVSLTDAIRKATGSSVVATEEGTKLATDTTRSAREIRLVIQQHETGTRQVSQAMEDVALVAQQSATSSREILSSSEDLARLSERLLDMTARFRREARVAEAAE